MSKRQNKAARRALKAAKVLSRAQALAASAVAPKAMTEIAEVVADSLLNANGGYPHDGQTAGQRPDTVVQAFTAPEVAAACVTTVPKRILPLAAPRPKNDAKRQTAYFSDRGRLFQADRGRRIDVAVVALGRRAGTWLNVAQSSTISLKQAFVWWLFGPVLCPF